MNTLIKIQDNFILVSDEEIKKGDKFAHYWYEGEFSNEDKSKVIVSTADADTNSKRNRKTYLGKVISENPDFSLLKEEDCKRVGWYDVEKLAEIDRLNTGWEDTANLPFTSGFERGFKTAQSLNDKIFSLEFLDWIDKEEVPRKGDKWIKYFDGKDNYLTTKELYTYWQSLQQTVWNVEVEMETSLQIKNRQKVGDFICSKSIKDTIFPEPKITNSIKITKIL